MKGTSELANNDEIKKRAIKTEIRDSVIGLSIDWWKNLAIRFDRWKIRKSLLGYEGVEVINPFKRPGVVAFLEHMARIYEIVVYYDQLNMYVDPDCEQLDKNHCLSYKLYQGCSDKAWSSKAREEVAYVPALQQLKEEEVAEVDEQVLAVRNEPAPAEVNDPVASVRNKQPAVAEENEAAATTAAVRE